MKHSELKPEAKMRANARAYANAYLARGKIEKRACEKCGSPDSQMHHHDYSKPLEVEWLCRPCHVEEHGGSTRPSAFGRGSCAKCQEPKAPNSGYCSTHRNEYQREWKRAAFRKLRELVEWKREHMLRSSGGESTR